MSSSAVAEPSSVRGAGPPASAPGEQGSSWWRVSWSQAAALRAVRAVIVIPAMLALTFKVIGDAQMTLFAVFGSFATIIMTSFAGTRRDKALAHLGLAAASSVVIIIGTLVSQSTWFAAVVTVPVAFAVYFAGSTGPNAASGVTACLLAYILPVASAAPVSVLPSRLEGWWLASAVSTAVVLLLSPRPPGDRLRAQSAALATALATQLDAAIRGSVSAADTDAALAAKHELMNTFVATPYRPIGLAAADQGLASLIHLLEWCASLISDASDSHLDQPATAPEDRELLEQSARALHQVAAVMAGQRAGIDLEALWAARLASARHLDDTTDDPQIAVRRGDHAYHAQAIGIATSAALSEAAVAARLFTPAEVAAERRHLLANLAGTREPPGPGRPGAIRRAWAAMRNHGVGAMVADASLRSVWFRNSARGAIALAAAVAVAKLTNVEHAFWVVLGTLSVLRTSASATGATALRGLAGTIAGFAVGGALLVAIGTDPAALWIAFPLAVLVAAYTPGTAPFLAGQASFTVTIVVLFNLLVPAGWKVGLLRVEDVGIGCAVSLVVGFLFWPRGISSVVGDNLADAFRSGSGYLGEAVSWALGESTHRPERAEVAVMAANRLDDAVRGYLTEQGSKRLSKADLWALVMAAMRLRLTAHTMASLPIQPQAHADDRGLHAALGRELASLGGFYDRLAAQVAKPARGSPPAAPVPLPDSGLAGAAASPCGGSSAYRSDALWVSHHLDHLGARAPEVTGPAERLAQLRRRPWWR